jgi:hypothetical protein
MSFLTPLYIAGALAVTLPILFHLIRRTPRGEIPFSSLMFLSPSPPRITRRSRIEHWLLLALRGLALVLLALAFSRPFWRQPAQAGDTDPNQHRVAIVVDTSASMRRGDLWKQAVRAVDEAIAACQPQDQIAVLACDETLRPIASFEDLAQVPPQQRRAVVADRLDGMSPSWAGTHLGQALLDAAAMVDDTHDSTEETGRASRRIVLVSDMQSGSRLNVLADSAWPDDMHLELKRVAVAEPTNAGLWRLNDDSTDEPRETGGKARELRIRVANAADSEAEAFQLKWSSAAGVVGGPAVDAYVPAGEIRIVRVAPPADAENQVRLILDGDAQAFDNTLYLTAEDRRVLAIGYVGEDAANDAQGLRYYVESAAAADPRRDVHVENFADLDADHTKGDQAPPLVVVAAKLSDEQVHSLRAYVEGGGTLLFVLTDAEAGASLAALLALDELPVEEAKVDGYAMLGEIDFSHPLFAEMAGPRFNDFTQIRFWKYRRVNLEQAPDARIVARFENRDPAVIEQRIGAGRLVALAAGWQPSDGQLARSWKFLLMLQSLVDDSRGQADFRADYVVDERVSLPERSALATAVKVTKPDGAEVSLADDATVFDDATQPGIYAIAGAKGPIRFAVNLDPMESETAPLATEAFEQLGVKLSGRSDSEADVERLQQLRDVELEGRQRIWQLLVAAALGVLIAETWLAGRLSRPAARLAVG